jgi:hypothetical protein
MAPEVRSPVGRGELALRVAHALAASADLGTLQRILGLEPEDPAQRPCPDSIRCDNNDNGLDQVRGTRPR